MNVWRWAAVCGVSVGFACGGSASSDLLGPSGAQPDVDGGGGDGGGGGDTGSPSGDASGDGAPTCAAGTADCDGNGANGCETATTSDDAHCGSCTNPCASGSSCQAGACVAGPATVVPSGTLTVNDAVCIGVGPTDVFVASGRANGDVYRVSKAGGAPVAIASNQGSPRAVATDATKLFWVNANPGAVDSASFDGTSEKLLVPTPGNGPFAIAADGAGVYWANGVAGTISRVDKSGANMKQIAPQPPAVGLGNNHISAIVAAGGFVYFTDPTTGVVARVAADGSAAPQAVVTGVSGARGVSVTGSTLYFTTQAAATGTVQSASLAGALPTTPTPIATGRANPTSIVSEAAAIYWIEAGAAGTIQKRAGNAAPIALVTGQAFPACIAIDGASLYWINENGAAVMRVAK